MLWNEKLKNWNNGIIQIYPNTIKQNFFYETSICNKELDSIYDENFIETDLLNINQDYTDFNKYIISSHNKYAISFYNLGKDCLLIIPTPRKNKNFTSMKHFIDNASKKHQKKFWKYVSKKIKNILKIQDHVYINAQGLGVSYFHLRLDLYPKYYQTKKFLL